MLQKEQWQGFNGRIWREEINLRDRKISKILELNHEDIMSRIKDAKRISQLPVNLTISTITNYFSGNSIIYPKADKIPSNEFINVANMLLEGKKLDSDEIINELQNITKRYYPYDNKAFELLFDKVTL